MSPWMSGCRLAAALAAILLVLATAPGRAEPYDVALLQGLDKVTARVSTIEAPVGRTVATTRRATPGRN